MIEIRGGISTFSIECRSTMAAGASIVVRREKPDTWIIERTLCKRYTRLRNDRPDSETICAGDIAEKGRDIPAPSDLCPPTLRLAATLARKKRSGS